MREHFITKHAALSPSNGLKAWAQVVAHREDGRIQTVEKPSWYFWMLLGTNIWMVWVLFLIAGGVSPAEANIAIGITMLYVVVNSFDFWLIITKRAFVRVVDDWQEPANDDLNSGKGIIIHGDVQQDGESQTPQQASGTQGTGSTAQA